MSTIAVVGAGISGLHLALRLQQAGVTTTLYTDRDGAELAASRPVNVAARFDHTRQRERALGVDHWGSPDNSMYGVTFSAPPLGFHGRLSKPASTVDFRIYQARLLADYADRGGTVHRQAADVESVARLGKRHDLVVVAAGGKSVTRLFPVDRDRSPYREPQRILCAGYFTGIAPTPERGLHFQLIPGVGEIFAARFLTFGGPVHAMNIEAIPGGALGHLATLSYDEDPAGFRAAVLRALAEYAPALRERVDEREFDLTRPIDTLRGGITPTVRTGWAALPDGGYAIAVGDAWVLNDPIAGQGANLGSHNAFQLADAIIAGPPYDAAWCRRTEAAMWAYAQPVTEWCNAFLQPPPEHVIEILTAASEDARIADAFVDGFNEPLAMWGRLGTPEGAATWLAGFAQRSAPAPGAR